MRRTHRCGEIGLDEATRGAAVVLQGWVWHRRDLGGLIFVDLRDRYGSIQCVVNPQAAPEAHAEAERVRPEYVVEVVGTVRPRAPENVNPNHPTGAVEVSVEEIRTLAEAETPAFLIEEDARASEEMRLRYRFLDLRRPPLQRSLRLRHDLALAIRNLLDQQGFMEIETPMLTRSTPEGARDYLVPSRVHPGSFYALPQSPQLFKQLLMISGYDRYFQIVRCFRDEDLRADRQPEFTQIDMEMSFVEASDVREIAEALMRRLLSVAAYEGEVEFAQLTFREALDRFGSDRPDMRYGNELVDVSELFAGADFRAFAQVVADGGVVKGLRVPGAGSWGRSRFDRLAEAAKQQGAKGLVWIKRDGGELLSPVVKFLGEELLAQIVEAADVGEGEALLLVGDEWERAATTLGTIRCALAESEGWLEPAAEDRTTDGLRFAWVTEFPLLERNAEGRLTARHHPFTCPLEEDLELLENNPLAVRAQAYDLVLNGVELGGGSIRIHRSDVQQRVFDALGVEREEASAKFGFLLRALQHGAPPHGGIAFGFDRIVMLLSGARSLRDTIAFPKTASASDLMTAAPGPADSEQLEELGLRLDGPEAAAEVPTASGRADQDQDQGGGSR